MSQTYFILDELMIAGYVSESNKNQINKDLHYQKEIFDEKEEKDKKKKWSKIRYTLKINKSMIV